MGFWRSAAQEAVGCSRRIGSVQKGTSALLQSTERQLERIAASVARKPAKYDAAAIGLAVGAVIDKYKMKKHFALDIADGRFAFRRREGEIAAEARLDGIYVVRTSLPADKVGLEQAVAAYATTCRQR